MEWSFPVQDASDEDRQEAVELNEVILGGGDDTEREKTEQEHDEKENEKQAAKEGKGKQVEEEGDGEEEVEEAAAVPVKKAPEGSVYFMKAGQKKLTNQFNFCERGALTYNNTSRVSSIESYR
jgi:dynein intermediate chain 1